MSDLQQTREDYYSGVNRELARSVALCLPKRVLEIGCGTGALGSLMKRTLPGLAWDGLEVFPSAAKTAAAHLDRVFEGSVEDFDLDPLAATYDTIVMGDVLEHLVNPWSTLERLTRILRRGGHLCLSVPNVNHWSIFYTLTRGRFPYAESGLLDRTHLRFFTRTELEQSVAQAGLKVRRTESIVIDHPQMVPFIDNYLEFQRSVGLSNPDLANEMKTFQWIVTATK